jgi:hypothetical protein
MVWQDPLAVQPPQALLRAVFTQAVPESVRRTTPCSVANGDLVNEWALLIKNLACAHESKSADEFYPEASADSSF